MKWTWKNHELQTLKVYDFIKVNDHVVGLVDYTHDNCVEVATTQGSQTIDLDDVIEIRSLDKVYN